MAQPAQKKEEKTKEQIRKMVAAYAVFKKSLDGLYIKRNRVVAEIRKRQNQSQVALLMSKLKRM